MDDQMEFMDQDNEESLDIDNMVKWTDQQDMEPHAEGRNNDEWHREYMKQ